jgi:hypothetical protein
VGEAAALLAMDARRKRRFGEGGADDAVMRDHGGQLSHLLKLRQGVSASGIGGGSVCHSGGDRCYSAAWEREEKRPLTGGTG